MLIRISGMEKVNKNGEKIIYLRRTDDSTYEGDFQEDKMEGQGILNE